MMNHAPCTLHSTGILRIPTSVMLSFSQPSYTGATDMIASPAGLA